MNPAVVTWGRGPALVALTASLAEAGLAVREVWCENDVESLQSPSDRPCQEAAPAAAWRGGMRDATTLLQRLDGLPDVALIAEVFVSMRIADRVLQRVPIMNVHPALLPRYRGAHPLPWQIICGETHSGVTFHLATREVDAGPILHVAPFSIGNDDNYGQVFARVLDVIRRESGTAVRRFLAGEIQPREQNHEAATFVVKRLPDDGWIDWRASAQSVRNLVRALTPPLPGAWARWNGRHVILDEVAVDMRFSAYVGRTCGQVAILGDALGILTGDAAIVPLRVRDAATGEDVTSAIRVNDRFSGALS